MSMTVCRNCPSSERRDAYEIQNREKHRAGDADHSAVFPKAVFGAVPKPLSGRDGGVSDRSDRLRFFSGEEKVPQPDAAVRVLEVAMRQNDLAIEVRDYLKAHPNAAVVNLG